MYINKQNGRIIKVGTGLHGTCRGQIYAHTDCEPGWLSFVSGQLLFRPMSLEEKDQDIELEKKVEEPKEVGSDEGIKKEIQPTDQPNEEQANKKEGQPDKGEEQPNKKEEQPDKKEEQPEKKEEQPEKKAEQPEKKAERPEKKDEQPEKKDEQPEKAEQSEKKAEHPVEQVEEQPAKKEGQPEKKEEQPAKKEEQSEKKEEQPAKKEEQLENKEEQPENKEEQPENKEEQPENKEEQPENKEEQPENKDEQPENKEEHPEKEEQPDKKEELIFGNSDDDIYDLNNEQVIDLYEKNEDILILQEELVRTMGEEQLEHLKGRRDKIQFLAAKIEAQLQEDESEPAANDTWSVGQKTETDSQENMDREDSLLDQSPSPAEPSLLCQVLDTKTLKPVCSVFHPVVSSSHRMETTSHMVGDGIRLYRVYQIPGTRRSDKKSAEEFEARVETFEFEVSLFIS